MDRSIPGGFIPPCKMLHQIDKEEQPKCTLLVSPASISDGSGTQVSLWEPSQQKAPSEKSRSI